MIGRRTLTGRLAGLVLGAVVLATAAPAGEGDLPRTEADLVETVRAALLDRDEAALDALINWDGAGEIKQRIVRFQVRSTFGRPIRSIELLPFPQDGLDRLGAGGTLAANMPVSNRLRVEFDEPPRPDGGAPVYVFLIGQQDEAYRIALVNRARPADDDD